MAQAVLSRSDSIKSAKAVGLRYVSDTSPGIRRRRRGKSFVFFRPDGRPVRDAKSLARIKALVIPPAWNDVWICSLERGHLQAVGRDARGRKQYKYHQRFRAIRDEAKYERMMRFVDALPKIRRRVRSDLKQPRLSREKVLATVVRLLETTLIRVGNDQYAQMNHSFGLTTMQNRHAKVKGPTIHFHFRGKSGVERNVKLSDARLARVVRRCQELPGQPLFEYPNGDGKMHDVGSEDVNNYLREITGEDFTAKDFRTWAGTVLAAKALQEFERCDSEAQAKKNIVRAIESVAKHLGNTPAVCRKCYVHPEILNTYMDGSLSRMLSRRAASVRRARKSISHDEEAVLRMLQKRLREDA